HGLDEKKLLAQVGVIRKLNRKFDGFRLFAGVECDILRDGTLDFPDEVLLQLDFVVASVHSALGLSEADMTRRVIRAMENQFVTMLAHPTGRLLLKREPYKIDVPRILDAAARTGTWIELNAAPKRLDLDWRWWPMAKQKGVKCVINPDAHRVDRLQDLWFGIGIARKGWLTKADVMNCLPLEKIGHALAAKRQRKPTATAITATPFRPLLRPRPISLTGLWRICQYKASPYTWLSQQWRLSILAPRNRQDREIHGSPTRRFIVIRLAISRVQRANTETSFI